MGKPMELGVNTKHWPVGSDLAFCLSRLAMRMPIEWTREAVMELRTSIHGNSDVVNHYFEDGSHVCIVTCGDGTEHAHFRNGTGDKEYGWVAL